MKANELKLGKVVEKHIKGTPFQIKLSYSYPWRMYCITLRKDFVFIHTRRYNKFSEVLKYLSHLKREGKPPEK